MLSIGASSRVRKPPDGDPLDVLILHDEKTWPGMLLACQPLGAIEMD
jgi:inorganic pyrophosphatase